MCSLESGIDVELDKLMMLGVQKVRGELTLVETEVLRARGYIRVWYIALLFRN